MTATVARFLLISQSQASLRTCGANEVAEAYCCQLPDQ